MTDPFPGFLLESRVIIDKAQVTNALSSFIDNNSRLEKKTIAKSVAGDRAQTVQFALADFDKSRLLCKDARYDATQRVLRGLAVSFRHYRQK